MAIPRSFLGGINLSGVLQLSSSAGTSGQFLVSQGSGNTPAWSNTLTSPTIDIINAASSSSTTAELFGNVTTGTVGIADGLTTGTLNIGNGATTVTGRTVNINTNASGSLTVTTNIGSSVIGSTINLAVGLPGVVFTSTGLISTSAVTGGNSSSMTLRTGNTTTSGNSGNLVLDVGTAAGTAGTVSLGATSSGVTIGKTGTTTTVNGTLSTTDAKLNNPLLSSTSTVGGGGSEGGQINFARVTDGAQYWYIDSFGSTASPNLRFIEGSTSRLELLGGSGTVYAPGNIESATNIYSGNVLSLNGKSGTVTSQDSGYYFSSSGYGLFTRTGGIPLYVHRYGTSGTTGMVQFIYNGANNGTINVASGGTPAFASGSDYRMKTDITPISDAVERMKKAKAYTFYKINEVDPSDTLHTGFIAHELAEVQPDAVLGEKDAVDENGAPVYQEVMEAKIIPVMAQAINDLIGMVESLTARVEALENR